MRQVAPWLLVVTGALAGCERGGSVGVRPSASSSASVGESVRTPSPEGTARVDAVRAAESRRDPAAVTDADVASPSPVVRRAVARALARIGGEDGRARLLRLLADEDAEVVAFAAYGIGWTCRGHEDESVAALASRVPSLPAAKGAWDPWLAVARAVGRCGTKDAEALLASWLDGPRERARASALGLADTATRRPLAGETAVALTRAATDLPEALVPFGRADQEGAVAARIREVAIKRLALADDGRIFAIRALGRSGEGAADELKKVLTTPAQFKDAERAEAARGLGRVGDAGQRALAESLEALAPGKDRLAMTSLVGPAFGPLVVALDALKPPAPRAAAATLADLVKIPVDSAAPASISRRVVRLRCLAARLLAAAPEDAALAACDPDPAGEEGELARLAVLARKPIEGPKKRAQLRALVTSKHARVRSAALDVVGAHREQGEGAALVALSLASEHAGTVAAAAQAIATRPELCTASVRPAKGPPPPDVAAAVLAALARAWGPDDTETVSALVDAAGAAHLAGARPTIAALCKSPAPTLRAHASRALELLGDRDAKCVVAPPYPAPSVELAHVASATRLVLDTEAGELVLVLDAALAPVAATRIADLARAGFYDGMAVHRVVPGFVVQFGDRAGDGTGGAGKDPLRCETSPRELGDRGLGVALAGRDTGSSQFFVTLSRSPHLDGEYTMLGTATGDWASVTEGDVIRKVTVESK